MPLFLAIFCFTALAIAQSAKETVYKAEVVGVVDGDTATVRDKTGRQITARLAGIDAPEKQQDFGQVAKDELARLIFGKKVTIVAYKQDIYGRTVAKILLDGKNINLLMVESGLAWHYKEYEDEQPEADRLLYDAAEKKARGTLFGLWKQANAVNPSDFRKQEQERADAERLATPAPSTANRIILQLPSPNGGDSSGSGDSSNSGSSSPTGNGREKTVNVKGYTKRDGTVVAPYKRSKPN